MSSVSTNQTTISAPPIFPNKNGGNVVDYPTSDGKPMGETDLHMRLISSLTTQLDIFLQEFENDYVMGDVLFYYIEGNPKKYIVPDIMLFRGIGKKARGVYKLWEEKKVPQVVFEISSKSTWHKDLGKKYDLYEKMGVEEYYIFDPQYKHLPEPLIGYHLKTSKFEKVEVKSRKIFSPALNLFLVDTRETLRLQNPETGEYLPTAQELANKSKELATKTDELAKENKELATKTDELVIESKELATKTEELESENKRLKAELEKLKKQT